MDESKVPHYFGPYPNWANSPLTLPDATVAITVATGCAGGGATADATVGANGAVTGISVTSPGNDYVASGRCAPTIAITGAGTGAAAKATVTRSGAVVAVEIDTPGGGYISPKVSFSGNGGAAATAYGGVDQVTVTNGGSGYTAPTVSFDLPDGPNGVQATGHAEWTDGHITAVVVDEPGSGYSTAPGVAILNGTQWDPVPFNPAPGQEAIATSTMMLTSIEMDAFGVNYNNPPSVTIADPQQGGGGGSGGTAHAVIDAGAITAIAVTSPGSGYITSGGMKKFVDTLPGLGPGAKNNLGNYIPVASAGANKNADDGWAPDDWAGQDPANADYYWIGLVEYTQKMHTSLPATKLRGYVQLTRTPTPYPLNMNDPLSGAPLYSVDPPMYLGPTIVATKDKPVRIKFTNLLPTGAGGNLFLPTDTTLHGSGMGPMDMPAPVDVGTVMDGVRNPACTEDPNSSMCFKQNRATLHLHGGNTPWISDGTPHQWTTPASESTAWPKGVSVENVPDMADPGNGSLTFYYSNQQSARLLFYHDHAWGITRLNVYAGEAAGYLIRDDVERKLFGPNGTFSTLGDGIPLVIQDRTFVPSNAQLAEQDPTWDTAKWGGEGNLWYHHVYMPAQNPGDPSGMSSFGRWMYGPWFWPPATDTEHGPIENPYYDSNCDPNVAEFCEPELIPGTPNISTGMEQFNDTPIVNGTAYPTVNLEPKSYRLRVLNAANDRFWNLQWYVADSTGTEVALKAAEVAAAQTDPVVFPTPDTAQSPVGPSWIQIGTEGGFLPAPVVIPNQPITWITDPTRFDVGNVDKHSLLLAPAERADVIVDFSKFAGKTLILYNDAPAAFPARIACYDYYTGGPDLRPACAPTTLAGYGPNTRTIMQVKIGNGQKVAFNLRALQTAFSHKANGSGVFESGQHPIIVGQAAYNSAYGTNFVASGWCNAPGTASTACDGFLRISEQGGDTFGFNTLRTGTAAKLGVRIEPKAIHDEMNSTSFDEYGRMQAFLGVERVPATPGAQNVTLHPYDFPGTEIIDATGLPSAGVKVTPIASGADGTQVWKITHNGVDTHPIHFHAYDVQLINRVTWDNIIIPPDPNELGWKDTVRISPLEDTIVALRPVIPKLPFEVPNSVRLLSPMMPDGATIDTPPRAADQNGDPITVVNHLVNFGAEYVYHCHILSHEEMDMMRPVSIALPPVVPGNVTFNLGTVSWVDDSVSETAYVVEKSTGGGAWTEIQRVDRLLTETNLTGEVLTFTDGAWITGDRYRVVAENTVGDTWDYGVPNAFPTTTAKSRSNEVS